MVSAAQLPLNGTELCPLVQSQGGTPTNISTAITNILSLVGLSITNGTTTINNVTSLKVNGAISGTSPSASVVISVGDTLYLSTYPGVDPTGVTDSRAAVVSFLAAIAGTTTTGVVDCPCYLAIGTDYTKVIFFSSNTNLSFTQQGYFICDNICTPTFVMESNCNNCNFDNWSVKYIGNFGVTAIDINQANVITVGPNANNITLTNYLIANNGNTFAPGYYSIWQGPVNMCANFMLRGACNNITFTGGSVFAAQGASATNFCPMAFSFGADWLTGVAVSGSTPTTNPAYAGVPYDISFDGMTFDGIYFGWQGVTQNISITNCFSNRYSDLWDGTSGTVIFAGSVGSGVTSTTLAANWAYATGTYGLTLSNSQLVYVLLTNGQSATGTFQSLVQTTGALSAGATTATLAATWAYPTGTYTCTFSDAETRSITFTNGNASISWAGGLTSACNTALNVAVGTTSGVTATATSGNQGGLGSDWFSPPHFMYLNSQNNFPCTVQAFNLLDYGVYVGPTVRRSQASGSLLSYKFEASNDNVFNGLVSFRPDGFADIQNTGVAPGAQLSNFFGVFNSQTATLNQTSSTYIWGIRFPNSTPYVNVFANNIITVDSATAPVVVGFLGSSNSSNTNCSFKNVQCYSNDCPTYIPEIEMGGTNMALQAELFYGQFSSFATNISAFANYGGITAVNSNFDITLHGWRAYYLPFTTTFANGATTGTLANNWPFSTGTYPVLFSNGNIRYLSLVNNSTALGAAFTALTSTATATTTATGLYNYNFNGLKSRILLNQSGAATGNHLIIRDLTNGYVAESTQGRLVETYNCQWAGTIPAGASYVVPGMIFPTTMAASTPGWQVTTTITGATSVEMGTNINATAFASALPVAASDTAIPPSSSVSLAGSNGTIVLTSVGSNFSGTGAAIVAMSASQVSVCP